MRIAMLAVDGTFDMGLSVPLDAFAIANTISARAMDGSPRFEVSLVGVRRKVRTGRGFAIPVQAIAAELKPDWVFVPALSEALPEQLIPALERPDVRRAAAQLRAWQAGGAKIAASCVGTFLAAEAGLLDNREATTTWWLSPLFRQRYPNVRLDETRMLVPTDVGVTAGAAMGHLDLALWLIRKASPELAGLVSRPMPETVPEPEPDLVSADCGALSAAVRSTIPPAVLPTACTTASTFSEIGLSPGTRPWRSASSRAGGSGRRFAESRR